MDITFRSIVNEPTTEEGHRRARSQTLLHVQIVRHGVVTGYRAWMTNADWDKATTEERTDAIQRAVKHVIENAPEAGKQES